MLVYKRPWTRQPQTLAPVHRDIAPYLTGLISGAEAQFRNCGPVTLGGGITRTPSAAGMAWNGDGSDNIAYATAAKPFVMSGTVAAAFTWVMVFRIRAASTETIAGYGATGGSSGNTLCRVIGGTNSGTIRLNATVSDGSALYNTDSSNVSANDGQWHACVVTAQFTPGSSSDVAQYYVDGREAGTVARGSGLAGTTTFEIINTNAVRRGGASVGFGNWDVALFAALDGVIMPASWCLKASRPSGAWAALFEPRSIYIPTEVAASGPTVTAVTPTTIGSTSHRPRYTWTPA